MSAAARALALCLALLASATAAAQGRADAAPCGEPRAIDTHGGTTTRYAYSRALGNDAPAATLLLLPGGSGFLNLDDRGCPRALQGNSLVRSIPIFNRLGFTTALVDAPTDHHDADGLGGFRIAPAHAEDLGRIVSDLRSRLGAPVWIVGTSRGTISAANAASRLDGPAAPDGVVLTSALTSGNPRARISWVAQSVFDLPLESIRMPFLIVGHAMDACARTPAARMDEVVARVRAGRTQAVTVTGGPGSPGPADPAACEGRSPHGFITQEEDVAAGIARFIRGGRY